MRIIGNADIREVQSPADEAERLACEIVSGLPNTLSYSKAVSVESNGNVSRKDLRKGLRHLAQSR